MLDQRVRFVFCDDLGSPSLGIIMNHEWCVANWDAIRKSPGIVTFSTQPSSGTMFLIPNEEDRLWFILKFAA